MSRKQRKILIRIIVAAILMIALYFVPAYGYIRFFLYMIPYIIIGYDILRKAVKGIVNRQVFDENFLMAIATVGAVIVALTGEGDYTEAIAVMLFYQIGELFQSYAVGKSRRNISNLMDIRPDYANVETEAGMLNKVDPDEVSVGSIIVIGPGEKVPLDGIITEGTSELDTKALTGESLPRSVSVGDSIAGGCINLSGALRVKTTKEFGESTAAKILDLVENASSRKSRSEAFISKFAKIYTPAVCIGALLLAVLPPLFMLLLGNGANWSTWIYRALTFLVISCPCALVVSIPLTFFASIGGASRKGILVKGSNYMETLSNTKYVVLDKTGTLTKGTFEVSEIHHSESDEQLIEYAALAECASSHPISKSLLQAYGKEPDRSRAKNIREISGQGVIAEVDGREVAVGNTKLMEQINADYIECSVGGTLVHVAINGKYSGHILISDVVKSNSKAAIAALKAAGVKKTVMLTGDSQQVAEKVANEIGIDEVHSEFLPSDKVAEVEKLIAEKPEKEKLIFAGDGINDAPVLSLADVGIAMGGIGSDAAIEAADVVIMDDDPGKIAQAIKLSKKCMRIVYQNIIFALGIKFLCLALGTIGVADMWLAIFADVGVMVIAVLNAIRALFIGNQ